MTRRVFNYGGGMHSPAALTQFIRDALDGEVANGMEVVAGSGMNVTVKSGTASVGKDPSYDINIIGSESVSVGAASPSNPMNTLIVAYVDRDVAGSTAVTDNTNDVFKLKAVSGAAAATPSDPTTSAIQAAIGAANPFIVLARVRKQAGATSVTAGDIVDLRKMITLRSGRINDSNIIDDSTIQPRHMALFTEQNTIKEMVNIGYSLKASVVRVGQLVFLTVGGTTALPTNLASLSEKMPDKFCPASFFGWVNLKLTARNSGKLSGTAIIRISPTGIMDCVANSGHNEWYGTACWFTDKPAS